MSDPSAELSDQQREEVVLRDELVPSALSAAISFVHRVDVVRALQDVPMAVRDRVLTTAIVGFLVGKGCVERPENDHPLGLILDIPEHLLPNVPEAVGGNAALRRLLPLVGAEDERLR